jgi:hypothetical protein
MSDMSVVFPAPENPTMATNSPSSIVRLMSLSTSLRCEPLPSTARVTALRPGRHRFRSYPAGIAIHPAEVMVRPGMDPLEIRWSRQ